LRDGLRPPPPALSFGMIALRLPDFLEI
jgi:hypothetical protein